MTTVSTTLGVLFVLVEVTGDDEGTSGQVQVICLYFHHLFNVDRTSLQRVGHLTQLHNVFLLFCDLRFAE